MNAIQLIGVPDQNFRSAKALIDQVLTDAMNSNNWVVEEVTQIDTVLEYEISQIPAIALNGEIIWQYSKGDISEILQYHLQSIPRELYPSYK